MKFNAKTAKKAGKRSGAARKEKSVIVEGLANAAARVELSVEALSAARRAGCCAFKPGNRVNIAELETWLLENGDIVNEGESLNAIRRRNILARIASERIAHDALAAEYVPAADVAEASRLCSHASAKVAKQMLPVGIRAVYTEKVTKALASLEHEMARKTRHEAPPALALRDVADNGSLDELRSLLLSWKTKFLELENAIANGEMIKLNTITETIQSSLQHPVAIARKHLDTRSWNAFAIATKEAFARAFNPTPLPA